MAIQSIGARYVPKFMGTHDNTRTYEALMVVDNGLGTSYIAKIPVPVNTPLSDETYWALYGASSGSALNLQMQIDEINDDIDDMKNGNVPGSLQNQINEIDSNLVFYVITPDMTQAEIQDAVATHDNIYISKGEYHFTQTAERQAFISLRDNMNLWVDGTLIHDPNPYQTGTLIDATEKNNINIWGHGTLHGDKQTHTGVQGEWQNCITIMNSHRITVRDLQLEYAWGDGIYIGGDANLQGISSYIYIDNVKCKYNRRCGIAVSSCNVLFISNSEFSGNAGTAPQAGIALETDSVSEVITNAFIHNCTSFDNAGRAAYATTHTSGLIVFSDCYLNSGTTTNGITFMTLSPSNNAMFYVKGCEIRGKYGIAATLNSSSYFIAEDVSFFAITDALIYSEGTVLNKCILKCSVLNSNLTTGLFYFLYQPRNAITKCHFKIDMCNSSVVETVHQYEVVYGDNIIDVTSNDVYEIISNSSRFWGNCHQVYTNTSHDRGVTAGINMEDLFVGTEYTLKNVSSYDIGIYSPGALALGDTEGLRILHPGDIITAKRVRTSKDPSDLSQIIIQFYHV